MFRYCNTLYITDYYIKKHISINIHLQYLSTLLIKYHKIFMYIVLKPLLYMASTKGLRECAASSTVKDDVESGTEQR